LRVKSELIFELECGDYRGRKIPLLTYHKDHGCDAQSRCYINKRTDLVSRVPAEYWPPLHPAPCTPITKDRLTKEMYINLFNKDFM
jgi:hypothetical protein